MMMIVARILCMCGEKIIVVCCLSENQPKERGHVKNVAITYRFKMIKMQNSNKVREAVNRGSE